MNITDVNGQDLKIGDYILFQQRRGSKKHFCEIQEIVEFKKHTAPNKTEFYKVAIKVYSNGGYFQDYIVSYETKIDKITKLTEEEAVAYKL